MVATPFQNHTKPANASILCKTGQSSGVCGSVSSTNYTVIAGDTLTTIAEKYASGICDIASVNSLDNPNLITPGQNLIIPTNCTTPDNTTCVPEQTEGTQWCVPGVGSSYIVQSGDTLSAIATNFNLTLQAIINANPQIENPDVIEVGQVVFVPICPASQCIVQTYYIESGDIFYDLAQTYGSTVGQLLSLNTGVNVTNLQVGQQIILPWNCRNVTTAVAKN